MRGSQNPSDRRKENMLARLIEEHGAAHVSKLFARVLKERAKSDPMASVIAEYVLVGVTRAEKVWVIPQTEQEIALAQMQKTLQKLKESQ